MLPALAKEIIELRDADLALRDSLIESGILEDGYNKDMEKLHLANTKRLGEIMNQIGYPTTDKVGEEASEAAWLIIQHSISKPDFMRKCRKLLEGAVNKQLANPTNLAYLTDRIAVFEGGPQKYGTQFDWDEQGALSPNKYDDVDKVNKRRLSIGLNRLEEQVVKMRKQAENDNRTSLEKHADRKVKFDLWRKKVGWIA